jgi:hypothetical protein
MLVFLCACVAFGCCALWKNTEGASHHIWNDRFTDTTLHRIQYPSPQRQKWSRRKVFTTANFSSSQFCHARREEFLPFSLWDLVLLTVYVTSKISSSQIFSSSHRRVFSNVWPGITSYIRYLAGTANCVPFSSSQIVHPLTDFFSDVWPGTTTYIRYVSVMSWTWYW